MVAIRDEARSYGVAVETQEGVASLAALWSKNGWHLERLVSKWRCVVDTCSTIAFVALKTPEGTRAVLLEALRRGRRLRRYPRPQRESRGLGSKFLDIDGSWSSVTA
jgi:hypothetical protein